MYMYGDRGTERKGGEKARKGGGKDKVVKGEKTIKVKKQTYHCSDPLWEQEPVVQ